MEQISRYEVNRKVRTILVRAAADMGQVSHSTTDQAVHIYGALIRDDGKDYTPRQVEQLMEELLRQSGRNNVTTDLSNWDVHIEYGSVTARSRKSSQGKYANAAPRHFDLEESEMLRELLDD